VLVFLLKLGAVAAISGITETLAVVAGIAHPAAFAMVFFGSVSFFLGPYLDGAGIFAKGGNYVNTATPGSVWRFFGILLWVIALITMLCA
jgi:hypothetical protein